MQQRSAGRELHPHARRFRLIDYEYSGNNDPCFELGNVWSESNLSLEQLEQLIAAYYGRPLRHKVARARLWGLMSKYGWTLWASIQDGVSDIDFDFWSWGMEKYDRAVAEFDSPDLRAVARRGAAAGLTQPAARRVDAWLARAQRQPSEAALSKVVLGDMQSDGGPPWPFGRLLVAVLSKPSRRDETGYATTATVTRRALLSESWTQKQREPAPGRRRAART